MAIYHFEGQIISRAQGRSSVAAAAYRSASCLVDKRTGLMHDFSNKQSDLVLAEILLPEGAPAWMGDREKLWNEVEFVENRKDAQLAREFNIALPKELSVEQNIALAREFISHEFVQLGMVSDVCFHRGHGDEQPHLHVMLILREVTMDNSNGSGCFGKKVRAWNDKAMMLHWRESWANACNHHLALHGHDMRIDHRSLEAQGINLEPQSKIGAKAAKERMAKFEEHQRIAYDNGKRILNNPLIALSVLTHYQSTFTHHDIAKLVSRHTATQAQFLEVYEKVKSSPELMHLGQDKFGKARYTTKAMVQIETTMLQQAKAQLQQTHHAVPNRIQHKTLQHSSLTDEQQAAFSHLMNSPDIAAVVGFAGTGKSHMLSSAKSAWEQAGFHVKGVTLSGIAAENLEAASSIQSFTIANRLIHWDNDRERLTHKDILVIDEAGMVGSKQMARILDEVTKANAKLVLIGDTEQLQAIEAGAAFRAIIEQTGFVELSTIKRQKEAWQQNATKLLATQQTETALTEYQAKNHVHASLTKEHALQQLIEQWQETRSNEPDKTLLILAHTRKDVQSLNEAARQVRKTNHELGEDIALETSRGEKTFAKGDRIYFLRNEKNLDVKNGSLGTITAIQHKKLTVQLDGTHLHHQNAPRHIQFHLSDYNDIDHGYAATIHKSQGSTVDRSFVMTSKHFDRHTTYVALSRHRDSVELFYAKDEFNEFTSLTNTLSRERTKDMTLDYAIIKNIHAPIQTEGKPQKSSYPEKPRHKTFSTHSTTTSTIDWLSPDLTPEWETLKSLNHKSTQWMLKFYELAKTKTDCSSLERIQTSITQEAIKVFNHPNFVAHMKAATPQLANIVARAEKFISKSKGLDKEM